MNRKIVLFLLFSFILSAALVVQVNAQIGPCRDDNDCNVDYECINSSCTPRDCIPGPNVVCIDNPLKTGSLTEIIDDIINLIFRISLVVVPLMIIYGGFLFVTGGGNPEQISKGKNVLIWTIIGLVVIILSKGLVTLLQTALGVTE